MTGEHRRCPWCDGKAAVVLSGCRSFWPRVGCANADCSVQPFARRESLAAAWDAWDGGLDRATVQALPADVRRLVIAARVVTDAGVVMPEDGELLDAVEAFSSRVPYDDEPEDDGAAA